MSATIAITAWFTSIFDWVLSFIETPWVLLAIAIFTFVDGLFPIVPSESLVIAVAAISSTGKGPGLEWLVLAAAIGAFTGDQMAFTIGRKIPISRIPALNRGRGLRLVTKANATIHKRPAPLLFSGRFIPGGRVAVNVSAGAMGFPRPQFMKIDAFAALAWAAYSTLLGLTAGAYLADHPFIAAAVGVVLGVLFGLVVDRLFAWAEARRERRQAASPEDPATMD